MTTEKADDLRLPMAVVQRIIKSALPEGTNVSKEARTAITRAAAVFVLHTSNFANENASSSNRKTITAADVLVGLKELECEELIEPVQTALDTWRQHNKHKKAAKKPRLDEDGAAADTNEPEDGPLDSDNDQEEMDQNTNENGAIGNGDSETVETRNGTEQTTDNTD